MLGNEYIICEIIKRKQKMQVMIFLICITQDDYVMLISHTKGYDEKKFLPNPKVLMVMLIQGVNLL